MVTRYFVNRNGYQIQAKELPSVLINSVFTAGAKATVARTSTSSSENEVVSKSIRHRQDTVPTDAPNRPGHLSSNDSSDPNPSGGVRCAVSRS